MRYSKIQALALLLGSVALTSGTAPADAACAALKDCHVLIIRHAEKADGGDGLNSDGQARARRYVKYFEPFVDGDLKLPVDYLVATADSASSKRPRLTLEPLSEATGLPIHHDCANKDVRGLVDSLCQGLTAPDPGRKQAKNILIAWLHGQIHNLIKELGGDPRQVLDGTYTHGWPEDVYNWVIELNYDKDGNVTSQKRLKQSF